MMRSRSILLAASSLFFLTLAATAQRPHYGGTLRVVMRETPQSLDPAILTSTGASNISRMIFETLVSLDERGRVQPLLAASLQAETGNQRWRLQLRNDVSFSDGSLLDASAVAASLRNGNPDWKIVTAGDLVIIETPAPEPDLPAELALPRNAIVRRDGSQPVGTGPFTIAGWTPGKTLSLRANDLYWAGRPFIDSVEIAFAVGDREQFLAMDLGKADVAEVAPENIRRVRDEGRNVISSDPSELMALVFTSDAQSDDEAHARNALAASIDSNAIAEVLLQGGGEATGSLLPNWLSGYGFVFPASGSEREARQRIQTKQSAPWTLQYDSNDPVARVVAERVLLNARDVGIQMQLVTSGPATVLLERIPMASPDPHVALNQLSKTLQLAPPRFNGSSSEELYAAEKSLLQQHRVIPLAHLRSAVALRSNIRDWKMFPDGSWVLNNLWLAPEKP